MHAPDISFTPTPSTVAIFNAYRMRCKQSDGSLLIYKQQYFQDVDTILNLYFTLQVKTNLLNITESFGKGRYYFSNLKADGTYQNDLTFTADNVQPDIVPQQKTFSYPTGTVTSVTLKTITGATLSTTVVNNDTVQLNVPQPGLYTVVQNLSGGGTTATNIIFSDELYKQSGWAILHLQIKPGDTNLPFTLTLGARKSKWQYYLIEPLDRGGSIIDPTRLSIAYSAASTSRYPATMDIPKKQPADYTPAEVSYVNGLKTSGGIKEVYLFESQSDMEIFDGEPPVVKLEKDGGAIVGIIAIPNRNMKNTIIIYKL